MLQVSLISIFRKSLLIVLLCLSWSHAYSAEHCSDQFYIEATLPNESKWDLCWEHRQREGIVYHHVFYTPKNGSRSQVLYNASIAQIHVPYDDNGARYHDVTDYGIGSGNMQALTSSECPNGTLKKFNGKNVVCQQIEKGHIAHHADSGEKHGNALSLFSISKIGAYHYIPQWRFYDDGTIQPSMGATGALQRFASGVANIGWQINSNRTGIAHLHNFFWRLDFDLGSSGTDDYIEEFNFPLSSGKRVRSVTKFTTEKAREVNPATLRSWRVVDGSAVNSNGHKRSYEILLDESGHKDKGPSNEPYTHNDFLVTKADDCEKFASHNPTTNNCKKNLAQFVNGESLSGKDIIVWVGLTFYHMPRVEDAPHMDAHWNHFNIVPRDWHANNPLGSSVPAPVNTAPTITAVGTQTNNVGDVINVNVIATDAENNSLTYNASGLPVGLSINDNGEITGTIAAGGASANRVTVTVSDGELNSNISFDWNVSTVSVNVPPVITNPDDQISVVGSTINLAVIATDSDNNTLTYSATGLFSGLTINSSTGVISGTVAAGSVGNHNITVAVNDGTASSNISFNWKVTAVMVNVPPVVTNPGDQTNMVGNTVNLSVIASDSDSNTLTYSATGLFSGLTINSSTGVISGTVGAGSVGSHNVTVTVNDGTGSSNITFKWKVNAASTGNNGIQIDGNDADWAQIRKFQDTAGENTSPVDIETLQVTGDSNKVYIAYHDRQTIDPNKSWAWQVLIDTDYQSSTGLEYFDMGGDYLLLGKSLYKYAGDGSSWDWTEIGDVTAAVNGKFAELAIDRSQIGQSNNLKLTFYGANTYAGGSTNDFFFVNAPNVNGGGTPTPGAITIDGLSSDWPASDAISDGADADTSPVDYQSVWFKQNSQKVYFAYKNRINIDSDKFWAWMVLIDSDRQLNTGINFYGEAGADFMLLGRDLYKYTGTGSDWSWSFVRKVSYAVNGKFAEIAVNKSDLGNSNNYRIIYYGSNTYAGGAVDDKVIVP
jgi:hypothetical protein